MHLSKEKVNTLKEELVFVATDSSTVAAVVVGRKAGKNRSSAQPEWHFLQHQLKSQLFALDGGLWPGLLCLQRTVRGWVSLSDLHGTFFKEFCLGARRPSALSVQVVRFSRK